MLDLYAAIACVFVVSVGAFWMGRVTAKRAIRVQVLAGVVAFAVFVLYLTLVRDAGWVTRWLPVSAVSVYTNPVPVVAAFVAGMLVAHRKVPAWRRGVLTLVLLAFGWEAPARLVFPQTPPSHALWADDVCMQSTPATCTPAAAATLLGYHGITTDEAEMARLCLTTPTGTHLLGLYRGLHRKTDDTAWTPRVDELAYEAFRSAPERLPAIVSVRLNQEALDRDPRYQADWGWSLGVTHSIVVYGFTDDGYVEVGDPGAGRERWSAQGLRDLWTGEVTTLARR